MEKQKKTAWDIIEERYPENFKEFNDSYPALSRKLKQVTEETTYPIDLTIGDAGSLCYLSQGTSVLNTETIVALYDLFEEARKYNKENDNI